MSLSIDLSALSWSLTGWRPFSWKLRKSTETGNYLEPDHGPFSARLPGSVQENLRRAGAIPDWHIGLNSLQVEWVEHRHWMFTVEVLIPALEVAGDFYLSCDLLDHSGWILVDGNVVGEFSGTHRPIRLNLGETIRGGEKHELGIIFDLPPEGQGQMGYTSRVKSWKPRFNFGWDWCVRVVPVGAAGRLALEHRARPLSQVCWVRSYLSVDGSKGFSEFGVELGIVGSTAKVRAILRRNGKDVAAYGYEIGEVRQTLTLQVEAPELWWPRGEGQQCLYELEVSIDQRDSEMVRWTGEVGFKKIEWRHCDGAPSSALPWICVVNGRAIFLQGVNWTPVRLCYMDTTAEEIRELVSIYQELGCNLLRVWGGSYLESAEFYTACDRAGLLVWQEFPLSSSGMDSVPPQKADFLDDLRAMAMHYVKSRQHHACLLQWCGGNELATEGVGRSRTPLNLSHPALAALSSTVEGQDPEHRFLPTSPYGPRFLSTREEFGLGLHHEVHGPWGLDGFSGGADWESYWRDDDALFRGEIGVAAASSLELILHYSGAEMVWPPTNPWWRHSASWWTQWTRLKERFSNLPAEKALSAYVEFTRSEQRDKLAYAARMKKSQFPRCGGFLVWMGHDAFPCPSNTSIVEFDRSLKPAALALAEVFLAQQPV